MKVIVLMSTYNGEKYIKEQIESILLQKTKENVRVELLVRDDGSSDKTMEILKEYSLEGKLHWYTGTNKGPEKSFWDLVNSATNDADYYAFCDQDDYWFEDKLQMAIDKLETETSIVQPLLYIGNFVKTDAELNPISSTNIRKNIYTDFAHSLVYSSAPGCTFVFNNLARNEFLKYDINRNFVIMHDWLAHKITLINGKMIVDDRPSMFYRQHGNNVIGAHPSGVKGFIKRVKRFLIGSSKRVRSDSARSILSVYENELTDDKKFLLDLVANYRFSSSKMKRMLLSSDFNHGFIDDMFFKLLILMKRV